MEILSVSGCPYEDNEGEVLNLDIRLDEGELLTKGCNITIEMMDDSFIVREVKIINPQLAGDYAEVSQEFINHVMSDAGTKFIESCIEENESWSSTIKKWKKEQGYVCFLPDDAGDREIEEF